MAGMNAQNARSLVFFLVAGLLGACAGSIPASRPVSEQPVDFSYELGGQTSRLSQLRGRPVVLVLMKTSDVTSQLYMPHVAEAFIDVAGETFFLVLTAQPAEKPFVEVYTESENLPFPIGTAEASVGQGKSSLGEIPAIPATYIIDRKGRVVDIAAGMVTAKEIKRALERAL